MRYFIHGWHFGADGDRDLRSLRKGDANDLDPAMIFYGRGCFEHVHGNCLTIFDSILLFRLTALRETGIAPIAGEAASSGNERSKSRLGQPVSLSTLIVGEFPPERRSPLILPPFLRPPILPPAT